MWQCGFMTELSSPGFDPAIHVGGSNFGIVPPEQRIGEFPWIAGSSPAMTLGAGRGSSLLSRPSPSARPAAGRLFPDLVSAEAAGAVVIGDADGLHPGIHDRRADELEAAPLQLLRDPLGERR